MAESNTTVTVDAVLFDMDGTLIDSTPGVLKAWYTFSNDYNLGDSGSIAHATHGRRLYDTLKEYCGLVEEDHLLKEIDRFEDEVIQGGPMALPGAVDMVSKLASHPSSKSKWTIVTSASNKYAPRALESAGVPLPSIGIITANDVSQGKPHPAPYLAGALKCSIKPNNCLVVEDAISGLKAGHAAGCRTLAVCTSTARSTIIESGTNPDFIVSDLTKVTIDIVDGRIQLTLDQS
ncbi:HAD-like domain-containing protein [Gymnopilus junonius]|uniref:HAD-like domain-containing protein n=1 Tax=Gymnopilus junonius TaxID=109634 RepID=A0A9P5TTM8_GYMJU|nr:HAD-like domain-containing protein [Gymnopilus junonius]